MIYDDYDERMKALLPDNQVIEHRHTLYATALAGKLETRERRQLHLCKIIASCISVPAERGFLVFYSLVLAFNPSSNFSTKCHPRLYLLQIQIHLISRLGPGNPSGLFAVNCILLFVVSTPDTHTRTLSPIFINSLGGDPL